MVILVYWDELKRGILKIGTRKYGHEARVDKLSVEDHRTYLHRLLAFRLDPYLLNQEDDQIPQNEIKKNNRHRYHIENEILMILVLLVFITEGLFVKVVFVSGEPFAEALVVSPPHPVESVLFVVLSE